MVKRFVSFALFAALLAVSLGPTACKHEPLIVPTDPTDTTGGNPNDTIFWRPCDPDSVYFQNQVLPILISSCAKSGCHDATSHKEGVVLTDYQKTMATAGVKPYKLSGDFYSSLVDSDPGDRMPPVGQTPLTSAQLQLIQKWILQGAKNQSCDETNPNTACDTMNVKYSTFVAPLIEQQCKGCHSGTAPQGNLRLTTYADAKAIAVGGSFVGTVERLAGFSPMPKGGQKWSDCNISKLKAWIAAGAKDN